MLEIRSLDAFYGESHILHGLDLVVPAGGRVALLGRNGAGKSTLMKAIMNAGPLARGEIRFDGAALGAEPPFARARMGLCLVPEDRRIFAHLTVRENVEMALKAVPPGRPRPDPAEILARFPMLVPLADRYGAQLSGGQQQMVAVARGLCAAPRLLLLDEPTEGLAPVIVDELARDVIGACARDGVALLLCEQHIAFARRCTDMVHVIDSGTLVFSGTWDAFDAHAEIKQRYLAL